MIAESVAVDENSADLKKAGASYYKKFDGTEDSYLFYESYLFISKFFKFIYR